MKVKSIELDIPRFHISVNKRDRNSCMPGSKYAIIQDMSSSPYYPTIYLEEQELKDILEAMGRL